MFEEAKSNPQQSKRIVALYSDIGRGHPSYLDSFVSLLRKKRPDLVGRAVFEESQGLSLLSWRFLSWLYSISGKGGLQTKFYNLIRKRSQKGTKDSLFTKILGRDLKRTYENFPGICLVDHPLIARTLAGICQVWYVHGEIAAPAECAMRGVEKILVPLDETKESLVACGAEEESILVCGLMIEPGLVETAKISFQKRLERIRSKQPLTVGFFTSGAYPKEHMEKILLGVESIIKKKMKAMIFCGINPRKSEWVKNRVLSFGWGLNPRPIYDEGKEETPQENKDITLMLVTRKNRQEDTQRAIELIPYLDVFVAASHERTNWAVGLGLPMLVLFPLIGTFASHNFEFAQKQKVVYPLDSREKAKNLGGILSELRQNGQLQRMAQNGFGVYRRNGIDTAVSHFIKEAVIASKATLPRTGNPGRTPPSGVTDA